MLQELKYRGAELVSWPAFCKVTTVRFFVGSPTSLFRMSTPVDRSSFEAAAAPVRSAGRARPPFPESGVQRSAPSFRESWSEYYPVERDSGPKALVTVQAGQTLVGMTRQHLGAAAQGLSPVEIYRMALSVGRFNGLRNPDLIRVGQSLDFSVLGARTVTSASAPVQTPTAVASSAPLSAPTPQSQEAVTQTARRISVVGDSIAVGIGGHLLKSQGLLSDFRPFQKNLVRNESAYAVDATGGHSSIQILRDIAKNPGVKDADLAIVSVGTNDVVNQPVNTYYSPAQITENLRKIRTSLNANRYLWVLPYDTQARQLVLSVARQFGDSAIDLADFRKADRYHPADYRQIVRSLNPVIQQALGTDAPDRLAVAGLPGGSPAWPSTASVLRARHSTE